MIYSISYDLNKPGQDYSKLLDAIKSLGAWAHPCDSHWLVDTNINSQAIFEKLKPYIDTNDLILVSKFDTADCAGRISKKIWEWIEQRKNSIAHMYR